MKRFICFCIILMLLFSMSGCKEEQATQDVSPPLRQVSATHDRYGNLLEQTIYNEDSGEYIIHEYTYTLYEKTTWVCTDHKVTIITKESENTCQDNYQDTRLNIYHNDDIARRPIILVDNSKVRVSIIRSLTASSWYQFAYELKVENKSSGVLTISIENAYIMNISCPPLFSIDHIEAGHTAYFTLGWDNETLERLYVPYIDNVEFMLKVYDNDNWRAPAFAGERILIKH